MKKIYIASCLALNISKLLVHTTNKVQKQKQNKNCATALLQRFAIIWVLCVMQLIPEGNNTRLSGSESKAVYAKPYALL